MSELERMRIDKWLWAARFFKTRSLATGEVERGRIQLNGAACSKPAREIKVGDTLFIKQAQQERTVVVQALSPVRGPASVAQTLYAETAQSIAQRELAQEKRRLAFEPADSIEKGRPTKRQRRELENFRRGGW